MQGLYEFKGADIRFLTKSEDIWKDLPFLETTVFKQCLNKKKGGQSIYFGTHNFFISGRSIFLVMFDMTNEDRSRVEYWYYFFVFVYITNF